MFYSEFIFFLSYWKSYVSSLSHISSSLVLGVPHRPQLPHPSVEYMEKLLRIEPVIVWYRLSRSTFCCTKESSNTCERTRKERKILIRLVFKTLSIWAWCFCVRVVFRWSMHKSNVRSISNFLRRLNLCVFSNLMYNVFFSGDLTIERCQNSQTFGIYHHHSTTSSPSISLIYTVFFLILDIFHS